MKKFLYLLIPVLSFISCDDYLDIKPVGQVIPNSVEDYRSFITSAYAITTTANILSTYRTDDLELAPDANGIVDYEDIYTWNDSNASPLTREFPYGSFYNIIFYTNHIIESQNDIEGDQQAIDQLVGEAHALRALQYFKLVNLYAAHYNSSTAATDSGVPITTSYDSEKEYPIETVEEVYALILEDLEQAETLINMETQPSGYNYRFSQQAVKAFKARVFLYQGAWQRAIDQAREALDINMELQNLNTEISIMPSEYNSSESILALETVVSFDLVNNASISEDLISTYHQDDDLRYGLYFDQQSNGSFRSRKNEETKFKVSFRNSELYLIQAEALARLGQEEPAKEALLELARHRYTPEGFEAYKLTISNISADGLVDEILEERRREFAFEGHRWNDLRRTTQPEITRIYDGETYTLARNDQRYVIPFPNNAVINNPDL